MATPFPILRPISNSILASSTANRSLQGNLQLADSIYFFNLSMELLDHHHHHHNEQQQQQQLTLLQAEHEDFGQEDLREQRPA